MNNARTQLCLQISHEGEFIYAYLVSDDQDDRLLLGSIRYKLAAQNTKRLGEWLELVRDCLDDSFEAATGERPIRGGPGCDG